MNLIQIAGYLGNDPEVRFTPSGQKVISFRVGTRSRRGNKDETIWFRVTIWGDRFDKMLSFLKKGSAVIVIGEMHKPEIYNDREGKAQVSLEITAEVIRFSPFGRPDKPEGAQGAAEGAGEGAMAGAASGAPSYQRAAGNAGYQRSQQPAAGAPSYPSVEGAEDFPQDDNLPF